MPVETRTELFIRLLGEALEANRAMRRQRLVLKSKAEARKYTMAHRSYTASQPPRDCVQMMTDGFEDPRAG